MIEATRPLVDGYALAVDRGDGAAFASLFTPDAVLTTRHSDGSIRGTTTGHADLATIPDRLRRYDRTLHVVTTHGSERDGSDPDLATGTSYCEAHHVTGAEDRVLVIRYDDTYRRDAAGRWRIAARDVRVLWTERRSIER